MNCLTESASNQLNARDVDRVEFILRDLWIGYTAAKYALSELELIAHHPKVHRMPNCLLVAETNNGKTVLIRQFIRMQGSLNDPLQEAAFQPIVMVQAPPVPDERRFYASLLDAVGMVHLPRQKTDELFRQV